MIKDKLSQIQSLIFLLLVFLIPSNISLHFLQNWSQVKGILVDYLLPTLYLTDILVVMLFLMSIPGIYLGLRKNFPGGKKVLFLFILILILKQFFSSYPGPALYKFLKIAEMVFMIFWLKNRQTEFKQLVTVLSLSVIWQSILAIAQWFNRGSIFGYWFFGEQPFDTAALGIKFISFFGRLRPPPLGTFTHPNVLAGFLTIGLIIVLADLSGRKFKLSLRSGLTVLSLVLGIPALFFTFSLPAWLVFFLYFSIIFYPKIIGKDRDSWFYFVPLVILFVFVFSYWLKMSDWSSFYRRSELLGIALKMYLSSPILGVGLNNFIPQMEQFGQVEASVRFLQPVHNIFLLILSETGLLGLGLFGYFLYPLLKKLWENRKNKITALLGYCIAGLLFLGLFDHYWLTIQQGMLLFSLILGLSLSFLDQRKAIR